MKPAAPDAGVRAQSPAGAAADLSASGVARAQRSKRSAGSQPRPSSSAAADDVEAGQRAGAGADFAQAMAAFDAGDYGRAEGAFLGFERRHSGDARCEDATFLRAVARARRGDAAGRARSRASISSVTRAACGCTKRSSSSRRARNMTERESLRRGRAERSAEEALDVLARLPDLRQKSETHIRGASVAAVRSCPIRRSPHRSARRPTSAARSTSCSLIRSRRPQRPRRTTTCCARRVRAPQSDTVHRVQANLVGGRFSTIVGCARLGGNDDPFALVVPRGLAEAADDRAALRGSRPGGPTTASCDAAYDRTSADESDASRLPGRPPASCRVAHPPVRDALRRPAPPCDPRHAARLTASRIRATMRNMTGPRTRRVLAPLPRRGRTRGARDRSLRLSRPWMPPLPSLELVLACTAGLRARSRRLPRVAAIVLMATARGRNH